MDRKETNNNCLLSDDYENGRTENELDSSLYDINSSLDSLSLVNKTKNVYPLHDTWNLWYWHADPQKKHVIWEHALRKVDTFSTVDGFWCLFHHLRPINDLPCPSDYSVFKDAIKPMWEDEHNIKGGRWLLTFPRTANREPDPNLEFAWLEVLLTIVGEGFGEFSDEICGAVINLRYKGDKISLWTANSENTFAKLKIGEILKIRTGYRGQMRYENHLTTRTQAELKVANMSENDKNKLRSSPKYNYKQSTRRFTM